MTGEFKLAINGRLLLISLAIMLLSLALPIALLQIYDRILPNQSIGTAWVLTIGVLVAMLLESSLRYGRAWLLNRNGMKFDAWSSVEAMRRLLSAPFSTLRQLGLHGIEESLTALKRYQDYYSGQALLALYDAPFIFLFLIMIGYVGGWVMVIPLTLLLVAGFTVYLLGKRAQYFALATEHSQAMRLPLLLEVFTRLLPFKAMAMEGVVSHAFDKRQRELSYHQAALDEYLMHIQLVTQFFSQATTVLVVMFSAHLVMQGNMSSGALAACTLLAGRTMAPVGALFTFWGQIQRSHLVQQKATELLQLGEDEPSTEKTSSVVSSTSVGLDTKTLQLPHDATPYTIYLEAGTAGRLPESGWQNWLPWFEALCGRDHNIVGEWKFLDASKKAYNGEPTVALVTERIRVFQGSVLENLTLFTPERESLVLELAKTIGLHERVIQLPQGYNTPLADRYGTGIDRGMEQLIGIVRAIAAQPQLLLFNHADRGLDIYSQLRFVALLKTLQGQHSIMLVSESSHVQEAFETINVIGG